MKKLLFVSSSVFAFVLTIVSTQVAHAASGYYAGVSGGQSKVPDACDDLPGGFSCDDSDSAWKIFLGYQATKNFGIEASFVDFGKFSVEFPVIGIFPVTVVAEASGFGVVGTGTVPLSERFGLFGKVGVFFWDVEARAVGISGITFDDDGEDLAFGFGAKVNVTENISLRAEWEQFEEVSEEDVRLLSAGVVLSF